MKKITREEMNALSLARAGRRHPVSIHIEALEVGEILKISNADWKDRNRSPRHLVTRAAKALGRQYEFFRFTDVRAWVVERVA